MAARAGIEPDYMRELLQVRRVPPPGPDADAWPWPVRVSLLGGFDLRLGEQPIRLPAKAPKKPLELLKLLAATAGSGLPLAAVEQHLWPDLDGAAARNACNVALHRLRRLLDDEQAVLLYEGHLSLNPQRVWTDVGSFVRQADRAGAAGADGAHSVLAVYKGHLLPEAEALWAQAPRERLRSRLLRVCSAQLNRLEQAAQYEPAVDLCRRVIEIDAVAEAFHQGLMRCLLALGRRAEAMDAWRRCSEQLYQALGTRPSALTRALRERIEAG